MQLTAALSRVISRRDHTLTPETDSFKRKAAGPPPLHRDGDERDFAFLRLLRPTFSPNT
jgi:hypothetical protein